MVLGGMANAEEMAAKLVAVAREYWKIKDDECTRAVKRDVANVENASNSEMPDVVGDIAAELIANENVPLNVRALVLATGIGSLVGLQDGAAVARELNISRAAVSKRTNQWADTLGYRRLGGLRSERTRERCSQAQKKNHWRRKQ